MCRLVVYECFCGLGLSPSCRRLNCTTSVHLAQTWCEPHLPSHPLCFPAATCPPQTQPQFNCFLSLFCTLQHSQPHVHSCNIPRRALWVLIFDSFTLHVYHYLSFAGLDLMGEAVACSRWHCVRGCRHTYKLLTFNLTCTCLDSGRKLSEGNCRDTGRTCKLCPAWYLPDQPSCYDGTLNRCLRLALVVTSRAGSCKNQRRVFPASLLGTLTRCYVVIDVKANDGYKVVLVTKKPSI